MLYLMVFFFFFQLFGVYQYDIKRKEKSISGTILQIIVINSYWVAGCRCVVGEIQFAICDILKNILRFLRVNIFSYALFDPLWLLLNSAIKIIWDDFFFFQFVHAILLNILLFYLMKRNIQVISLLLFFFYFSYLYLYYNNGNTFEKYWLLLFFLYALRFYKSGNWGKYYLMVFVCFLFHSSAVVTFFYSIISLCEIFIFKVFC